MKVLVDEIIDGQAIARSYSDAPEVDGQVIIRNPKPKTAGEFADVVIEDADEYDLYARLL